MTLQVEFCGEYFDVDEDEGFLIGREGPLDLDDNPYLHRRFLVFSRHEDMWWVENVGSRLSATVSDAEGTTQAWLSPGARLPLVHATTTVLFTAGPTTYELSVLNDDPAYPPARPVAPTELDEATIGPVSLTPSQRLLVLALAEPVLSGRGTTSSIPSTAAASARLGWTTTRFNRKLDAVCEKLGKYGVRGLHGGPKALAVNRRARLVEHAVASRLVTAEDLADLDAPQDDESDD